jgi:serine/threonine protein kinase
LHSEVAENLINQLSLKRRPLKDYFDHECDRDIVTLVLKMLEFNPYKRIDIEEALQDPIFHEFRNEKPDKIVQPDKG